MFEEKRDILYPLSFIIYNTNPVGHQDLVSLVISMLRLGDFSLVFLTFLHLYSISLADVFWVLFVLPLGILLPLPTGINALFSHGPKRSSGVARVYALWNVVVAFICGDESEWWIFPVGLVLCKCFPSRLINWHIANLEIQDRSLYSTDFDLLWQS